MSSPYKTFSTYTFGCKVNFADTSSISRSLIDMGFVKIDFNENPDIYLINTCSVTENADKKAIRLIKKIIKNNSKAKVIVTGCYAQLKPKEIVDIPGVSLVIGMENKFDIAEILEKDIPYNGIMNTEINNIDNFQITYSINERTRAFVKIQDGCDYLCTYCTIPKARGNSRSLNIEDTIKHIEYIVKKGAKEIILSGINVGDFGINNNENLAMLLQEIENIDKLERYRISSIEPNLISDEILDIMSVSNKALPHFHIPMQSGSDKILSKMKRRYNKKQYKEIIGKVLNKIPNVSIGVDVIVGFPGENDQDFLETYSFIKSLDVAYLHVFKFSERLNTEAVDISDKILEDVKNDRRKKLVNLSNYKKELFINKNIGKTFNVLFESQEDDLWQGLTDNYIKVYMKDSQNYKNKIIPVKLLENKQFVVGEKYV